jgi:flavin-binding protein dodecin
VAGPVAHPLVLTGVKQRARARPPGDVGRGSPSPAALPLASQAPSVIKGLSVDAEIAMSNHVYRVLEVVGSSPEGVDGAIRNAVARAARTTRNLDWFEVTQIRGQLDA